MDETDRERGRARVGYRARTRRMGGERIDERFGATGVVVGVVLFGLTWAATEVAATGLWRAYSADESAMSDPPAMLPDASIWLVDGYNVLHVGLLHREDRSFFWGPAHRERLRARARCFQRPDAEVWLVFDGSRPSESEERSGAGPVVRTLFASSADEWLVRRLREVPDPGRVAVVTADRRVAGRARHRGAHVVSPGAFLAYCDGA